MYIHTHIIYIYIYIYKCVCVCVYNTGDDSGADVLQVRWGADDRQVERVPGTVGK